MKRLALITFILGAALAIVPLASAHVLLDGSVSGTPTSSVTGITPTETQAMLARGEVLNQLYGNASTKLSPSEFANGGSRLSPQELAAATARGEALNSRYGVNGITFRPDILGGNGNPSVTPASGTSFDWSTTLGATLGAMLLLAAAATVVTRRRHQHQLGF